MSKCDHYVKFQASDWPDVFFMERCVCGHPTRHHMESG